MNSEMTTHDAAPLPQGNVGRKERLPWLDALRGFTMILVVAYHVAQFGFLENEKTSAALPFLVLMRMPLFFFVSGFLAYKADCDWTLTHTCALTWKKLKVQVIPAMVFLCLFAVFKMRGGFTDNVLRMMASPTKGGYWFTWVLLHMFLIYYAYCAVGHYLRRFLAWDRGVSLGAILLLWAGSVCLYETLYLPKVFAYHKADVFAYTSLVQTFRFLQFFLLGNIVRRYWRQVQRLFDTTWFFPLVTVVAVACCADIFRLHTLRLGWANLPRTVAMYSLSILVVMFFRYYRDWFSRTNPVGRVLSFIGSRTLDIYLLHFLLLPKMPEVGRWLNAHQPNFILSITLSVSVALLVIAFCLTASQLLRVSPFLRLYLFGRR